MLSYFYLINYAHSNTQQCAGQFPGTDNIRIHVKVVMHTYDKHVIKHTVPSPIHLSDHNRRVDVDLVPAIHRRGDRLNKCECI